METRLRSTTPWIETFLSHLKVDRGYSANTLAAYEGDLRDWFDCLHGQPPKDITAGDLQRAHDALIARGYKAGTLARKISAIHRFFEFFAKETGLTTLPSAALIRPSTPKPLPKGLSKNDIDQLLITAQKVGNESLQLRDRALITLLYATGMRISECLALTLQDLRPDTQTLMVQGKGSKQRYVPTGDFAWTCLNDYIQNARASLAIADSHALWVNANGKPLTRQGAWQILKQLCFKAGIEPLSPHRLRHAFATHLLAQGMSLRSLQKLLGHSDLTTTERYLDVEPAHLQTLIRKFHPRG